MVISFRLLGRMWWVNGSGVMVSGVFVMVVGVCCCVYSGDRFSVVFRFVLYCSMCCCGRCVNGG